MAPQMIAYRWFAKSYGWTPDQVDELSLEAYRWLPLIEDAADHAAEVERKRAERDARRGR